MRKAFWLIFLFLNLLGYLSAQKKDFITPKTHPGLRYTENKGQWPANVNFRVQMSSGNIFLENDRITYFLFDYEKFKTYHMGGMGKYADQSIKAHAYAVEILNANPEAQKIKSDELPYYENYFLGNDKSKWQSNVKSYKRIVYEEIYKGIDLEALTNDKQLKYNYYIKPGSDYKNIQLKYTGDVKLKLKDDELIVTTSFCDIVEKKPYAYQVINGEITPIPCRYKLTKNVVSFEILASYDPNQMLIIDPILVFAAQSGSTADNFGMTATYDSQGNLYTGGTVFGLGYPTSTGAYSNVFNGPAGGTDVVISKYNSVGNNMLYSTYIGGNGSEVVGSLIVNKSNELYLYGATGSSNFPMLASSYDNTFHGGNSLSFVFNGTTFNNGTDIYLCKLNTAGTSLLASTYIGGSANDGVNHVNITTNYNAVFTNACPNLTISYFNLTEYKPDSLQHNYGDQYRGEIQLDNAGNVYVASSTRSSNFPTVNAFDNTLGGKQDAVVFKFDPGLSNLIWSSYLGGTGNDAGYSLIVTDSLFTYVTGGTFSTDFPVQSGCYATTYNGGKADGFIAKINPAGNAILKATYIGTNSYDQSYFVQKDKNCNIYVYGQSEGIMPTVGPVYSNPNSHQFIAKLDNQLTNLNLATVIGSGQYSIDISPSAFSVDNCGNICISGWGGNITNTLMLNGMATTTNALYASPPNGFDFYLMALSPNMSSLLYGTYFGGNCSEEHVDGGTSRFDPTGKVYQSVCAGCGGNDDFPVSNGAWPCGVITPCPPGPNLNNNCNNGVFKIDFELNIAVSTINTNTFSGCNPLTVNFTNATAPTGTNSSFIWYFGNGQTNTTNINPSYTYTVPGNYTVSLVVIDPATCNVKDSSIAYITVLPSPNTAFTASFSPCSNTVVTTNNSSGTLSATPFIWDFGDGSPPTTLTSPSHTYGNNGVYTISLISTAANGCTSSATQTVSIFNFSPAVFSAQICEGQTTTLTASGGTSYTWNPSTGLSNPNIANPVANPSATAVYTVTIENNSSGFPCTSDLTTTVVVNPNPTSQFTYSVNPCGGGVYFYDMSVANVTNYFWQLSPTDTSYQQNPYHFYPNGGTFVISLLATNIYGCTDVSTQTITVSIPPPVSISNQTAICAGQRVQLQASGGDTYSWSPASSLDNSSISNPVASPTTATNYSVIITTSTGCQFLLTTLVRVSHLSSGTVSAYATPTSVVQGNTTTLVYLGDPGSGVSWFPSTNVNPKTGYTVTAMPDRPTTYTVQITNGACKEKLYVFVDVFIPGCEEGDVFVPNTFTPNGDGQNDILYVRGIKVQEVYFAVYNRWGEKVFETTDKNVGWDGIYKNRPADVGVFGWYLKVKCFDGNETFKKGNVTLIR